MEPNVAGQFISAVMTTISDGSPFTGTVTTTVTIDGGTQTAGSGTVTHEGGGEHSYALTQAETNGAHIAVKFTGTGALSALIQTYTFFPQTVDNATGIAAIPTTPMRGTDSALLAASINLTGGAVDTVTTLTGQTPQTGDSFAIVSDGVFGNSALNDSIGNISGSGTGTGAVNASGATITTGVQTLTFTATQAEDGIVHEVADSGGNTDFEYTVTLAANQSVTNVTWRGYIQSNGDSVQIQFFDYNTSAFVTEATINGTNGTTLIDLTFNAISAYTGTGANLGEVRLRFLSTTSTNIATDRLRFVFSSNFQSVGYADGAIWVDTNNGTAGTAPFINGVGDLAVLTFADMLSLSSSVGLERFKVINASSLTLTGDSTSYAFIGETWFLALGGQKITSMSVTGANISGTGTDGGGARPIFQDCVLSTTTLPPCIVTDSGLSATVTAGAIGDYSFKSCVSAVTGLGTPVFDFGALLGNINLNMRHYSGGIEIQNMGQVGTDKASIEGDGQLVINANCVGGEIVLRGDWTLTGDAAFISAGGTITFDDDTMNIKEIKEAVITNAAGVDISADVAAVKATVDAIPTTAMRGTDNAATATNLAAVKVDTAAILVDTDVTIPAAISGIPNLTLAAGDIDGFSLENAMKLTIAPLAGKLAGAGTSTNTIRAADDSKARITATVDAAGNRTAITLDVTG